MLTDVQNKAIFDARANISQTSRPTVQAVEAFLHKPFPVLDYGFIRCIDYMGDDRAIVQAARVSYGTGTKQVNDDAKLISYLLQHCHTTPFEMCEIKFHVKMPIFVMRQWIRQRMASVNEYSARYSILDKEFYIPDAAQLAPQSAINKQGRSGNELSHDEAGYVLNLLRSDASRCYDNYKYMLNEDDKGNKAREADQGIARELARINLNLNYYTQCYWKIDLHNLFNFLKARTDSHAQYEIRVYADVMLDIVRQWVPMAHAAFIEHRKDAAQLSASAIAFITELLHNRDKPITDKGGMSVREWEQTKKLFKLES